MSNYQVRDRHQNSLNAWLDHFEFQRFPFGMLEAGDEHLRQPDVLAQSFVKPISFDAIFGYAGSPETALVFADRGTGKTACRVMIDYYCSRGEAPVQLDDHNNVVTGFVLSVTHIHFSDVLQISAHKSPHIINNKPGIFEHTEEIMRRAIVAFTNLLSNEIALRRNIQNLPQLPKYELIWLSARYGNYLSLPQAHLLNELGIYNIIEDTANFPGFLGETRKSHTLPKWFDIWLQGRSEASPLEDLSKFAAVMNGIGVEATYILVDGLDEIEQTVSNPSEAFEFVLPLLANMRLMDGIPYLAVKFFLPDNLKPFVTTDPAIRRDRISTIETISWNTEDLRQILQKRITASKQTNLTHQQTSFDDLCVPEIWGWIEDELIKECYGNPRSLMNLCGLMIGHHLTQDNSAQENPYKLNRIDFHAAVNQLNLRLGRKIINANEEHTEFNDEESIYALIKNGETETVEFKARLFINSQELQSELIGKTEDAKKKIRQRPELTKFSVIKAIAGMLNTEGGVLLIGVSDDGSISGIDQELDSIKGKKGTDGFALKLSRLIEAYLGLGNLRFIRIRFLTIENKTICAVFMDKAPWPIFLDNKGTNQSEFYIRGPNSTRKLDPKQTMEYIQNIEKKN